MSVRDEFTEEEWFLLGSVPAMIAAAMSSAAPSGVIGTVKELTAGMRTLAQGREEHAGSPLIAALLERAENWDAAREKAADYRERSRARLEAAGVKTREELQRQVERDCRAAAALVDERADAADAAAYKDWSVTIAREVARAAKEGGVLGFGGERVSDEERVMLARIEQALGVPTGVLVA